MALRESDSLQPRYALRLFCKLRSSAQSSILQAFLNAGVLGITLADLSLEGLATTLASFTPEEQTRVLTVVTNVAKEEDTIEYVKQTVDKWGRLDISVQSAGELKHLVRSTEHETDSQVHPGIIHFRANVEDMDMAVYDRVMAVNVRGCASPSPSQPFSSLMHLFLLAFLGIKHSAKAMLASPGGGKGASIVLLTSTAGLDGEPSRCDAFTALHH